MKKLEPITLTPNLKMQGEFKSVADVHLATDFTGKIISRGSVNIPAGFRLSGDVTSQSLHVAAGAYLRGKLEIGQARKVANKAISWWYRMLPRKVSTGS